MRKLVMLGLLAAGTPLMAQIQPVLPNATRTAQGDVAVTIYNGDTALVQDRRELALAGRAVVAGFPRRVGADPARDGDPERQRASG